MYYFLNKQYLFSPLICLPFQEALTLSSLLAGTLQQPDWLNWASLCSWVREHRFFSSLRYTHTYMQQNPTLKNNILLLCQLAAYCIPTDIPENLGYFWALFNQSVFIKSCVSS